MSLDPDDQVRNVEYRNDVLHNAFLLLLETERDVLAPHVNQFDLVRDKQSGDWGILQD